MTEKKPKQPRKKSTKKKNRMQQENFPPVNFSTVFDDEEVPVEREDFSALEGSWNDTDSDDD